MPLTGEEAVRLRAVETRSIEHGLNIENWIRNGKDVHERNDQRLNQLDREWREFAATLETIVEELNVRVRDERAMQTLANKGFETGLSTLTSRIETTRGELSEMQRQVSRKTDSGQVNTILEHKVSVVLGIVALFVLTNAFKILEYTHILIPPKAP